jgi:hypothetical protein
MRPIAFRDPRFAGGPVQVALRKLEAWLEERKWNLVWSRKFDDHVNYTDRMIVINANRTAQSQIFGILHEIGHILLSETPDYMLRFANTDEYKHRRERNRETLKVRAETLGEEWEAWCQGESFARKNGITIDFEAYHASRNRDLKSYARWMLE